MAFTVCFAVAGFAIVGAAVAIAMIEKNENLQNPCEWYRDLCGRIGRDL
jgi:hypothetical protein